MPDQTTDPRPVWRRRLLAALCWFMAFEFAGGGAVKFLPGETVFGPPYAERFTDWGYPSWFRFVVGGGELVAAALLLVPRRRYAGAAILVVVLTGAVLTHVVNQDPLGESVSAPIHLALAGLVAWAHRPVGWRDVPVLQRLTG